MFEQTLKEKGLIISSVQNTGQTDDGFGDFLGGPSSAAAGQEDCHGNQDVNKPEATPPTISSSDGSEQKSVEVVENIPPKEEKKGTSTVFLVVCFKHGARNL